jgi:hypothetical protein
LQLRSSRLYIYRKCLVHLLNMSLSCTKHMMKTKKHLMPQKTILRHKASTQRRTFELLQQARTIQESRGGHCKMKLLLRRRKVPAAHSAHSISDERVKPAGPYEPGEQGNPLHTEAPVAKEKNPASHATHTASDDCITPAGSNDPGEHVGSLQDEAPAAEEKVPALYCQHTVSDYCVAPAGLYDPGEQADPLQAEAPSVAE